MKKFLLLLFIVTTGICLNAQTVVNVSPGEGSLSAAIKAAGNGDILVLENGQTYTESTDSMFILTQAITIESASTGGTKPVVKMMTASTTGTTVGFFGMRIGSSLTVRGIDFNGKAGDSTVTYFVRYYETGTSLGEIGSTRVEDCNIEYLKKDVFNGQSAAQGTVLLDSVIVINTFIHDVGPVIHLKQVDCKYVEVRNSTFANFQDYGIRAHHDYGQLITPTVVMDHVTMANLTTSQPSSPKLYFIWGNLVVNPWTITYCIFANTNVTANTTSKGIYWKGPTAGTMAMIFNHNRMWLDGARSWKESTITYSVFDTATVNPVFADTAKRNYKSTTLTALGFGDQSSLTAIKDRPGVASTYQLEQNYPNPFNPSTNIRFSLKESGNVHLTVYNALGREVASLVNEYMTKGNHEVEFNASNLPSGLYFYTIKTANFSVTKKMTLLK